MAAADIPAGMQLKDIAGWNQTSEDWARFLQCNPEGCFVAECEGRIAGTVATIIYEGRLAWIGMVLVDPAFRGRGIGAALLGKAVESLEVQGIPCIKLDATPLGKPLYERLGFKVELEIERWALGRITGQRLTTLPDCTGFGAVLEADRDIFGADRSAVLSSIAFESPDLVSVAEARGSLQGYALGRKGSLADHLGPWAARNGRAARQVLEDFLERSRRDVIFVDVVTANSWARALVNAKGFVFSRGLTRMYRGENRHPGLPQLVCGILGPEFG
jgi:GNAT superfamily N-acetyltransferase